MKIQTQRNVSMKGTVKYVCDYKKKADVILHSSDVIAPVDMKDKHQIALCIETMSENVNLIKREGRKVKEPVGHHFICFNKQDTISTTLIKEVITEYVKDRNLSNTKWMAIQHFDTENPHVHLVFSRVANTQKLLHENDYKVNTKLAMSYCKKYSLTIDEGMANEFERIEKGQRRTPIEKMETLEKIKQMLPLPLQEVRNLHHLKILCTKLAIDYSEQERTVKIGEKKFKKEAIIQVCDYNRQLVGKGRKGTEYEHKQFKGAKSFNIPEELRRVVTTENKATIKGFLETHFQLAKQIAETIEAHDLKFTKVQTQLLAEVTEESYLKQEKSGVFISTVGGKATKGKDLSDELQILVATQNKASFKEFMESHFETAKEVIETVIENEWNISKQQSQLLVDVITSTYDLEAEEEQISTIVEDDLYSESSMFFNFVQSINNELNKIRPRNTEDKKVRRIGMRR